MGKSRMGGGGAWAVSQGGLGGRGYGLAGKEGGRKGSIENIMREKPPQYL